MASFGIVSVGSEDSAATTLEGTEYVKTYYSKYITLCKKNSNSCLITSSLHK